MKKERIASVVFWVLLVALAVNWEGLVAKVSENLKKPEFTPEALDEARGKFLEIVESARSKGENLTAEDYHRDMLSLLMLRMELYEEYLIPSTLDVNFEYDYAMIFNKPLKERLRKENRLSEMETACNKVWHESGFKGVLGDKFDIGFLKKAAVWLLRVWFVGCVLSVFLYIYRRWIREKSAKEIILLQPLGFLAHVAAWPAGVLLNYPEDTVNVAYRYHSIKTKCAIRTGKKVFSEQEEQMFWQQARDPVERFDLGVRKALAYSRVVALVSTLIICALHPKGLEAGEVREKEEAVSVVKVEEFSGFLQFMYEDSREKSMFSVPLAVVGLKGRFDSLPQLSWKLEADLAGKEFRDVFFYYALDEWINIKVGRWFAFFTSTPPPNKWYLVEYPKTNSIATIYGTGVVADGDAGPFRYYLGILNGNEAGSDDNNKEKDFYANLAFRPTGGFSIGAVCQRGKQPEGMRDKFGSHIKLDIPGLRLKLLSEYMHQKTNDAVKRGWYVLGLWHPWKSLQFVGQFDTLRESQRKQRTLTFGINYLPHKNLKLQLNYAFSDLGNRLLAKAQVSF